jgi:uncharacterized protein YjbI with pentapeptide repeats
LTTTRLAAGIAELLGANLSYARFGLAEDRSDIKFGADLRGTVFTGASLEGADLSKAVSDAKTV